ncbi:hypothetical protein P4T18_18185 [Bacillus inaquosorum]|uniref:hypothetical protein n=1 Tax=Bacillus inaquosorum TaxID=483913 RepID=UPI002E1BCBBC|nr:hypothetical protein [Bacillus inaquosorum]
MDKTLLHETITEMYKRTKAGKLARQERIEETMALVNAYYDSTGEQPDVAALDRMANLIIYEELSDSHPDKVTRNEYPIMSETQFEERYKREASDKLAEEYDQNGAYKGRPIRRTRSTYENKLLDKRAKARNLERRKRYSAFVNGKSPGQFTVNIFTGEKTYH